MSKWLIRLAAVIWVTLPIWARSRCEPARAYARLSELSHHHQLVAASPRSPNSITIPKLISSFAACTKMYRVILATYRKSLPKLARVAPIVMRISTSASSAPSARTVTPCSGWRVNTRPIQDHWNRFPLLGAHAALTCDSCHTGRGGWPIRRTQHPVHQLPRPRVSDKTAFSTTALRDSRPPAKPVTTRTAGRSQASITPALPISLSPARTRIWPAATCHAGNHFQGVPSDCASCHLADFTKTTNPNHVAAGFSRDCATCHNTATWDGATFDHNLTKFPLTGAHTVGVACASATRTATTPTSAPIACPAI